MVRNTIFAYYKNLKDLLQDLQERELNNDL